jgi:hypothetical protein
MYDKVALRGDDGATLPNPVNGTDADTGKSFSDKCQESESQAEEDLTRTNKESPLTSVKAPP